MLRERNTVADVAEHWGCSGSQVRKLIDSGVLPALRLGGMIRITREQVEACEAACNTKTQLAQERKSTEQFRASLRDPFQLGRDVAGRERALKLALETEKRRRSGKPSGPKRK